MPENRILQLLIVDDDELNRDIIMEHLDESDYIISSANDGDIAIEMLEKEPTKFDIILLDRMMPRMGGMEVLARIKQHPQLSNIPVILQTARTSTEDIIDGMKAGANYYLTKPFKETLLKTVVNTAGTDRKRFLDLQQALLQSTRTLALMQLGCFHFQTLAQASDLATMLANACPDASRVVTGLSELMINAIEHGNLGIGYDEKSELNTSGHWLEEVNNRTESPHNKEKWATISFEQVDNKVTILIKDQGQGFDWHNYLELDPERAFDNHGRGIAMAKMLSFDALEYLGTGNEVRVTILT
ncbi:MAG: response regulator [Candidatus Polarisedimenticolaceae bacterium]|nr:response regulator [Candidatus Polarisedimenticolaceae bacterium]